MENEITMSLERIATNLELIATFVGFATGFSTVMALGRLVTSLVRR